MIEQNKTLARIEEQMKRRHWSIYRLSKESGIPYNTLYNLFSRNNNPSIDTTQKLCNCFGISISELFSDDPMPEIKMDYSSTEKNIILDFRELNRNKKQLLITYLAGLKGTLPNEYSED